MKKRFAFTTVFLLVLIIQQKGYAEEALLPSNSKLHDRCTLLGPDPSFIVKLKDSSPARHNQTIFKSLSLQRTSKPSDTEDGLEFANYQKTIDGDYLVSFKTPSLASSASIQDKAGCYAPDVLKQMIQYIQEKLDADYVIPNQLSKPNELIFPGINPIQWNLLSLPAGIDVQGAWDFTRGRSERIVAVLDTGQLKNNALDPNTLPGVSFIRSGFYPGHQPSQRKVSAYNHGTHVAGIIASSGKSAYGKNIYGVAPLSKVLPVNIFTVIDSNWACRLIGTSAPCLLSYQQDQINALGWLAGYKKEQFPNLSTPPEGIVAVNMSLGGVGECDYKTQKAIDRLLAKNIAIVVAAGNENVDAINVSPANCKGVIPVASVGVDGLRGAHYTRGPYSNFGKIVKIAAPGGSNYQDVKGEIYSTGDANYFYSIGTSMASPHVAGLIALLSSIDSTLTPSMMLALLQETATQFPDSNDSNVSCQGEKSCGAGIINAAAAVKKAKDQAAMLSWNRNLQLYVLSPTEVIISWSSAQWVPERKLLVRYTVSLDQKDVKECSHIASTVCKLSNLKASTQYTVVVKATDPNRRYGSEESVKAQFSTPALPVTQP